MWEKACSHASPQKREKNRWIVGAVNHASGRYCAISRRNMRSPRTHLSWSACALEPRDASDVFRFCRLSGPDLNNSPRLSEARGWAKCPNVETPLSKIPIYLDDGP